MLVEVDLLGGQDQLVGLQPEGYMTSDVVGSLELAPIHFAGKLAGPVVLQRGDSDSERMNF